MVNEAKPADETNDETLAALSHMIKICHAPQFDADGFERREFTSRAFHGHAISAVSIAQVRSANMAGWRACALLQSRVSAAIIGVVGRRGDPNVKVIALEALQRTSSCVDQRQAGRALLSSSFREALRETFLTEEEEVQICTVLVDAVDLPDVNSHALVEHMTNESSEALIEQLRSLQLECVFLCLIIEQFPKLGWHKAFIRAGAAKSLVRMAQLYSPLSSPAHAQAASGFEQHGSHGENCFSAGAGFHLPGASATRFRR